MNYIINPSQNDIIHSAKGKDWKTHKYISKKKVNGKWVYVYTDKGGSIADKIGLTSYKRAGELAKKASTSSDELFRSYRNLQQVTKPQAYTNEKDVENARKAVDKYRKETDYYTAQFDQAITAYYNTPMAQIHGRIYQNLEKFSNLTDTLRRKINR